MRKVTMQEPEVEETKEVKEMSQTITEQGTEQGGKVTFENIEAYKRYLAETREELIVLVQEQTISEATANRLLADYEYNFFQQLVKVVVK